MFIYSKVKTSAADLQLITEIAARVERQLQKKGGYGFSQLACIRELETVHHLYPLRLQAMRDAIWSHLIHDIGGIKRHLDRDTGELMDGWVPRFIDARKVEPEDLVGMVMREGVA